MNRASDMIDWNLTQADDRIVIAIREAIRDNHVQPVRLARGEPARLTDTANWRMTGAL